MLKSRTLKKNSWRYSKPFIVFLIVFSLVVPSTVLSVGFGAFLKKDEATLHRGETAVFEIFFYSRTDESAAFLLSLTQTPEGFDIEFPDSFDLGSPDLKDEFVLISGEYVKGKVVEVTVVALNYANPGEHAIMLKAVSSGEEGGGGTLGVKTEKTFFMKVNVAGTTSGSIPPDDGTETTVTTTTTTPVTTTTRSSQNMTTPRGIQGEENELNQFLIIIAAVLMVVFLILVYLNYNSRW